MANLWRLRKRLEASRELLHPHNGNLAALLAHRATDKDSPSFNRICLLGFDFELEYADSSTMNYLFGSSNRPRELILQWGDFKLDNVEVALASCIKSLYLFDVKIRAKEAHSFQAWLCSFKHLTVLGMSHVSVEGWGHLDVAAYLLDALIPLESLLCFHLWFLSPISCAGKSDHHAEEGFAIALLRTLASLSSPRKFPVNILSIHLVNKDGIGEECMSAMAEAVLAEQTSVKEVILRLCTDNQWEVWKSLPFCEMVEKSKSLVKLSCWCFRMLDEDLMKLLKCVGRSESLEKVSLWGCKGFTDSRQVVGSVVDLLSSSCSLLQELDLTGTTLKGSPAIEAQLARNHETHRKRLHARRKVPATAARLFICGEPFAGKTTLLRTLRKCCKGQWKCLGQAATSLSQSGWKVGRTRGINIRHLVRGAVQLMVWDMAGDLEYHAFHDHMFPFDSSPSFFLFVWSPVKSSSSSKGISKTSTDYERSLRYWLKFIASKSKRSAVPRKVIVAVTRKDQMDNASIYISLVTERLRDEFKAVNIELEMNAVFEVDARNMTSVSPLLSLIFDTAHALLERFEVYNICDEVRKSLGDRVRKRHREPIISWEDFEDLCQRCLIGDSRSGLFPLDIAAEDIAAALNESGDLIFLHGMDFLVLDVKWFCGSLVGELINFSVGERNFSIEGGVYEEYLVTLLQSRTKTVSHKVEGKKLVQLMEKLHLCCRLSEKEVFIPSTLQASASGALQFRDEHIREDVTWLGRRLQCRNKRLTSLTSGFFHTLQVSLGTAFHKIGANVNLGQAFIWIQHQDMHIVSEFCCKAETDENAIDILVRMSSDVDSLRQFEFMEEEVVRTITRICAEPAGDQGVDLVESVIRPECLEFLASFHEREDHTVPLEDLKNDLLNQLQSSNGIMNLDASAISYKWKKQLRRDHSVSSETSPFIKLLGAEEMLRLMTEYKESLHAVAKENGLLTELDEMSPSASAGPSGGHGSHHMLQPHSPTPSLVEDTCSLNDNSITRPTEKVDIMCQLLAKALDRLRSLDSKVDELYNMTSAMTLESKEISILKCNMLSELRKSMDQILNLCVEKEAGRLPRLCVLATGVGTSRALAASLTNHTLSSLHMELMCEHRLQPHRVRAQQGINIMAINSPLLQKMLPYVNGLLKVLGSAVKLGGQVTLGMSPTSVVRDLTKIIDCLPGTQAALNSIKQAGWNGQAGSTTTVVADFEGWEQWLANELENNGGLSGANIYQKFKLQRALYTDTSQVAWLCDIHIRYPKVNRWHLVP